MIKGFVRHEIITRDVYFNKRKDADAYASKVIKQKGFVLYIGINYDNRIPYDYRVSIELERTNEVHKNTIK